MGSSGCGKTTTLRLIAGFERPDRGLIEVGGKKVTAIFVTHDQEEALFTGDLVAVIDKGSLIQIGAPEEIFHFPAKCFVAEFMGQTNFLL